MSSSSALFNSAHEVASQVHYNNVEPQQRGPAYGDNRGARPTQNVQSPGQLFTMNLLIPTAMVDIVFGGDGDAEIRQVRVQSGSVIEIHESPFNNNERMVRITGQQEGNEIARRMIYERLGEYPVPWVHDKDKSLTLE